MASQSAPVTVCCVSAPQDENWLRRLEKHLSLLKNQGLISPWHARQIFPSADWTQEIDSHLESASLILLLVSANFFASDYCWGIEMKRALAREAIGQARVIPILVHPVDLKDAPFSHLHVLPTNAKPLSSWSNKEQALANVASGIRRVITEGAVDHLSPDTSGRAFWSDLFRDVLSGLFKEVQSSPSGSAEPSLLPQLPPFASRQERRLEIIDAPVQTKKVVSSRNVFLFNEGLLGEQEFFGRKQDRITLLDRSSRGASTSIVGPRRIGKTWLLEYLRLVALDQLGPGYRVGYVNATMPSCDTVSGFTRAVLESLGVRVLPKDAPLDLKVLEEATQLLKEEHVFPILCIDEFEGLNDQNEFDLQFFRGLRAIGGQGLVLVTASKRELFSIVGNNGQTSGFFNIFEACILLPFGEEDAREFVQVKGDQAKFGAQERALLLKYGQQSEQQWSPLRLQLTGKLLVEDQNAGSYRPDDLEYQRSFSKRLEKKYRAVVVEE